MRTTFTILFIAGGCWLIAQDDRGGLISGLIAWLAAVFVNIEGIARRIRR
jgi:hypothetical protein